MDRLRTPEERFDDLPDFPFLVSYAHVKDPTVARTCAWPTSMKDRRAAKSFS